MKEQFRVLIIDDDEVNNFICSEILRKSGKVRDVITLKNADEGLDFLMKALEEKSKIPDILMVDINMPFKDGWEFLNDLRKAPKNIKKSHMKIFILSSSVYQHDKEIAESYSEVKDFIIKPLTIQKIEEVFKTHFH